MTRRQPEPEPLMRDLHIDHRVYRVEHGVWAEFKRLHDLLAKMTERVARLSRKDRAA